MVYSEHRHRHIVETGLSLLSHASLPLDYWPFAFFTAVFLVNCLLAPSLNFDSMYIQLSGTPPNYSCLQSFGCLCYLWLWPYTSHKLAAHSLPCIFVGYSTSQNAYLFFDSASSRIYVSRHVRFVESIFSYASSSRSSTPSTSPTPSNCYCLSLPLVSSSSSFSSPPSSVSPEPTPSPFTSSSIASHSPTSSLVSSPSPSLPPTGIVTRSNHNIFKPRQKFNLTASYQPSPSLPTTVQQALYDPLWHQAMDTEF